MYVKCKLCKFFTQLKRYFQAPTTVQCNLFWSTNKISGIEKRVVFKNPKQTYAKDKVENSSGVNISKKLSFITRHQSQVVISDKLPPLTNTCFKYPYNFFFKEDIKKGCVSYPPKEPFPSATSGTNNSMHRKMSNFFLHRISLKITFVQICVIPVPQTAGSVL